jgi:hypothetical protein
MSNLRQLRVLVCHGPDSTFKYELLAWLRGRTVCVDARTVDEMTATTLRTIDERVNEAMSWADKAIVLVTPDSRSPSGAPNVIDEIGRWRGAGRAADLAILRHTECKDMWSNLAGVVRLDFESRVNECFVQLLDFLGLMQRAGDLSASLTPAKIGSILDAWRNKIDPERRGLFIVMGGAEKYDDKRMRLGLKEYQSTAPVTGVVRLAVALAQTGAPLMDAVCDYHDRLGSPGAKGIDLVLVGGPDTNRIVRELFAQDTSQLPVWFDPPTGSDNIITRDRDQAWSRGSAGLILGLRDPAPGFRHVFVCAGNGARGTNGALTVLARYISGQVEGLRQLGNSTAIVVEGGLADKPSIVWADG